MPTWKTFVEVTDQHGNTGTAETPVCADTENEAAVAAIEGAKASGFTPVDGRVYMEPTDTCQH